MDTAPLIDLAPILGVVLGSMLAFTTAIMRYQHVDSTKSRDLIEQSRSENRELIEQSRSENRELIEQSQRENRELIEKVHGKLSGGLRDLREDLGYVRERLARIEGYLGCWPEPPHEGASAAA